MQIEGPGATDPHAGAGVGFVGQVSHQVLGGRTVDVYAEGSGNLSFFWTEPDGGSWLADIQGLTAAAARSAVAGLSISAGRLDAGSRPAALPRSVQVGAVAPERSSRYFYAAFSNVNQDQGGWTVEVHAAPYQGWQALVGARQVDVHGIPGWTLPGKLGGVSWTAPDGTVFVVGGSIDPDHALQVARSLTRSLPTIPA
jgi:hypothetical protein